MSYVTRDSVATVLGSDWATGSGITRAVLLANAWLNEQCLEAFEDDIPEPVIAAGAFIAQEVANGTMYQGRTEGILEAKSTKIGSITTSKTFATGDGKEPITAGEQAALSLIAPYLASEPLFLTTEVY